jgi:putative ATPase
VESILGVTCATIRGADRHYDTISAFIKSLRGSDAKCSAVLDGEDAGGWRRTALFFGAVDFFGLCEMWDSLIHEAIVVVNAAAEAFERVGMPEGNYFLSAHVYTLPPRQK